MCEVLYEIRIGATKYSKHTHFGNAMACSADEAIKKICKHFGMRIAPDDVHYEGRRIKQKHFEALIVI